MTTDWVRGQKLGHGSFATVNLAVPKSQSHQLMAVKSCGVLNSSLLMNEKLILDELKCCPEVIRCLGESFSYESGEKLYNVLLEYAPGGALADKIKNSEHRRLPESEVRQYTKAILRGLNYIHNFGYVHCDIKLQNILLGPNGSVKIADFGLAKRVGRRKQGNPGEFRGTPMYMSPEVVTGGEQDAPADIWALGCVVTEMLSGMPAWQCFDVAALLMRIGVGDDVPEVPSSLSENGKDFLRRCFAKDPRERWTAEMLLSHQFVSEDLESDNFTPSGKDGPSPRCPFDFPDWESSARCSITSLSSPEYTPQPGSYFLDSKIAAAKRLRGLSSEESPDWSVSDDWINVR